MKSHVKYGNDEPEIPVNLETMILKESVDVIKETIRCFTEYSQCREREKSERKRIAAQLRAYLKKVEAIKEIELAKIKFTHEERMRLLDAADKSLEIARQNGDIRILKLTFEFINVTLNRFGYADQISASNKLLIEE